MFLGKQFKARVNLDGFIALKPLLSLLKAISMKVKEKRYTAMILANFFKM